MKRIILTLVAFGVIACLAANDFKLDTRKAILYRGSVAYLVKSGKINVVDGKATSTYVPQATDGSIWYQGREAIKETKYTVNKIVKKVNAYSYLDIIKRNYGKQVKVVMNNGNVIIGKCLPLYNDHKDKFIGNSFLIANDMGLHSINTKQILQATFPNRKSRRKVDKLIPTVELTFHEKFTKKIDLSLTFLTNKISWTPAYLIHLNDDNEADITLKATIVNNADSLYKSEVDFVVGKTSFVGKHTPQQRPRYKGGRGGDKMMMSAMSVESDDAYESYGGIDVQNIAASELENLYIYSIKGVSLNKGDVADYNIFSAKADYEDIYKCELGTWNRYNRANTSKATVWHALKIKNESNHPWITALALIIKDGRPLAQKPMPYTSKKDEANIDIMEVRDIVVSEEIEELTRTELKSNGKSRRKQQKVTLKSEIKISNFKTKTISLVLKKDVEGKILSAEANPNIKNILTYNTNNPLSKLKWTVKIAPGQSKIIELNYSMILD